MTLQIKTYSVYGYTSPLPAIVTTDVLFCRALSPGESCSALIVKSRFPNSGDAVCRSQKVVSQMGPRILSLFRDSWKNVYHREGSDASGRTVTQTIGK